jgi:hypothetical protein
MKAMEKRPQPKNRKAVKQSVQRESPPKKIASTKQLPLNTRLKTVELIDEISLEQIPWKSVSSHQSGFT